MKFVSKNSNLMVVLRPGIPGNRLSGVAAVNGIYIKFQGGMVDVKEDSFIQMMKEHPGFGSDFVTVEEKTEDPFAYQRREMEPVHVVQNIKYGHAEGVVKSKQNTPLSPEIRKMLQEEAIRMAKEMLPGMMKEMMNEMRSQTLETNAIIEDNDVKPAPKKGKGKTEDKAEAPTA